MSTRTALVGGGARGIGRATAERLARDGRRVLITGRDSDALRSTADELSETTGGEVGYLVSDIADPASAEPTVAAALERLGRLDILVLNAGGPPPGRVLELDDPTWRSSFELLVLGPLRLVRAVLPGMIDRGFGRIVLVTSTAVRQPQPDLAASVVLRSAMTSAVNLISRECAAAGVTVNCVAPGATATDRRRQILERRADAQGRSYAEADQLDVADIPAGRAADPAEVAAAIAFLTSDDASYLTGTALSVDGGRTESI